MSYLTNVNPFRSLCRGKDEMDIQIDDTDHDSTLGDEMPDTKSLASSMEDYVYENGRRYHAYRSGQYMYPNDELEADREDLKHHATRVLLDGRLCATTFDAPPMRVLDIGTGTGIWAMQFADDYPESSVVGVDLSPIQPIWVPPNLEFLVEDISDDDFPFPAESFSFIHIRFMGSAIRDWPKLLRQCHRALKPGGKIELVDYDLIFTSDDGSVTPEHQLVKFCEDIVPIARRIGCDLRIALKFGELLGQHGFGNIATDVRKLPMGKWPRGRRLKTVGVCHREQFLQGLPGIAAGLLGRLDGRPQEEVLVYTAAIRNDIFARKYHGYWKCYFVTAEKQVES